MEKYPTLFKQQISRQFYIIFLKRARCFMRQSSVRHANNPFKSCIMLVGIILIFLDCKMGAGSHLSTLGSQILIHLIYIVPLLVWLMIIMSIPGFY